jgi:hypothetical protein
MSRVRLAYRDLRNGDVATVLYFPGSGVTLLVNRSPGNSSASRYATPARTC